MENNKKTKKLYQKWWFWVIGIVIVITIWNKSVDFIDEITTKKIPNVMGVNYSDAILVLEKEGFDVTEIEANAESILSNSNYANRSVKKGEVFKINDCISASGPYPTKNKNITIYYAEKDYIYEEAPKETTQPTEVPKPTEVPEPQAETKKVAKSATKEVAKTENSSGGGEEWRQFLKDYEAWVDSYIEFMKKYKENPTDVKLISDYAKFAKQTVEWADKADTTQANLDDSPEALKEYIDTLARITTKIASIAY